MPEVSHGGRSLFAAAVALLLFAGVAAAQSVFPPKLDLEAAVAKALESDPQIRASKTAEQIADARTREARTGRLPTVQFSQSFTRSNNPVFVFGSLLEQGRFAATNFDLNALNHPDGLNNFRSAVSIRAPIFDGWQTRTRVDRAKIGVTRAGLETEAVSQKLRFDVIRSFYGAILADELLKATNASVRSAKENSRNTKNFVDVGMVAESDSLVANVELANVEQQQLEAESAIVTTRAALNISMGERPATGFELVGDLQERYFPIEETGELVRIALEQRPDYRQAILTVEDSKKATRSARDQKLPRLDAFGNYGYSTSGVNRGSSDYTVGLSLSYMLFEPGRKERVEESTLAESAAVAAKDRLENQITLEVITADQNYRTARAKIQVSAKSVIQAEEALRILQDRYHNAISTFEAVLRAEAALLRAKHELLKAKYDYYISYASVLLATGRLTDVRTFDH